MRKKEEPERLLETAIKNKNAVYPVIIALTVFGFIRLLEELSEKDEKIAEVKNKSPIIMYAISAPGFLINPLMVFARVLFRIYTRALIPLPP
jgi:hypothetical protein